MFQSKSLHKIMWGLIFISLISLPMLISRDWHFMVLSQLGITIIFAISFNQLLGQTGLLNLGHSIFMGAGSYFSGLILLKVNGGLLYIPLPILPLFGGLAGFTLAAITGYFSVQRAGMIFAMMTLAMLEFVNSFSISFPSVLGGMTVDRTINTNFFDFDYGSRLSVCLIVMIWSLYQGIILIVFVLYFPKGLTGFFVDQRDFIKSKSKLRILSHYIKIIVPAIIATLSIAWLIESLNTILHHQEKANFLFLWILFSVSNPMHWSAAILLSILGIYFLTMVLKSTKDR